MNKLFGKWKIDVYGSPATLSNYHYYIHESKAFTARVSDATLAAAASLYMQLQCADDGIERHLKGVYIYTTGTDAAFELNEGTTLTTGTTGVTAISRNRVKVGVSDLVIFDDPTGISAGMVLESFDIGTGHASAGGGSGESDREFVLAPNTRYLLTLKNNDSGTKILNMRMDWYEVNE